MQEVKQFVGVGSASQDGRQVVAGFGDELADVGDRLHQPVDVLRVDAGKFEEEVLSHRVVTRLEITV